MWSRCRVIRLRLINATEPLFPTRSRRRSCMGHNRFRNATWMYTVSASLMLTAAIKFWRRETGAKTSMYLPSQTSFGKPLLPRHGMVRIRHRIVRLHYADDAALQRVHSAARHRWSTTATITPHRHHALLDCSLRTLNPLLYRSMMLQ